MISHSAGELGCAYADKCLTIEQTILSACRNNENSSVVSGPTESVQEFMKKLQVKLNFLYLIHMDRKLCIIIFKM